MSDQNKTKDPQQSPLQGGSRLVLGNLHPSDLAAVLGLKSSFLWHNAVLSNQNPVLHIWVLFSLTQRLYFGNTGECKTLKIKKWINEEVKELSAKEWKWQGIRSSCPQPLGAAHCAAVEDLPGCGLIGLEPGQQFWAVPRPAQRRYALHTHKQIYTLRPPLPLLSPVNPPKKMWCPRVLD